MDNDCNSSKVEPGILYSFDTPIIRMPLVLLVDVDRQIWFHSSITNYMLVLLDLSFQKIKLPL